jgi:F-type H+-transporting ATPase subunit delta
MKLDKDSRKLSKELYQASLTNGRLDSSKVSAVARQIISSKPRHYVGILKEFQRLVRLEVERHHAVIESAAPLDGGMADQLAASLRNKYGADLTTEFKVNPELLGGLRIKVGSDVFDGSVRERLHRLETQLTHA